MYCLQHKSVSYTHLDVYKRQEFTSAGINAGNLNSIGFDVTTAGTAYTGYMVKVGTTSASALTTTFVTGLTQVYYTGLTGTITPTVGINSYNFGIGSGSSSAINWNGTDNLVIEVSWSNNNGGGTAAEVKYDNTSSVSYPHLDVYKRQQLLLVQVLQRQVHIMHHSIVYIVINICK